MINHLLNALQGGMNLLDAPGAMTRNALTGRSVLQPLANPFSSEGRATGHDLLHSLTGMKNDESRWDSSDFAAPLLSAAVDPLSYLGTGLVKHGLGRLAAASKNVGLAKRFEAANKTLNILHPEDYATATMKPLVHADQYAMAAPPFYSRLAKAAENLPDEPMKAASVPRLMKQHAPEGFHPEEWQHTGMDQLLHGKATISKDEILKHIDENGLLKKLETRTLDPSLHENSHLTLTPNKLDQYNEHLHLLAGPKQFIPEHYRDVVGDKNILAHHRTSARNIYDETGKPKSTLFQEVSQSDLHQTGKKLGYKQGVDVADMEKQIQDARQAMRQGIRTNDPKVDDLIAAYDNARHNHVNESWAAPDMPFKKDWQELNLKHLINDAVHGGYEQAGWNTGQQMQKISGGELTGQVHNYDKVMPGMARKYFKRQGWDAPVEVAPLSPRQPITVRERNTVGRVADKELSPWNATEILKDNLKGNVPHDMVTLLEGVKRGTMHPDEVLARLAQGAHQAHAFPITDQISQHVLSKGQSLLAALLGLGSAHMMSQRQQRNGGAP